jgi:V8-like Glu-specific endopeptidase
MTAEFNSSIITVGTESGTCFAVSPDFVMTAGHVAQQSGDVATVNVGDIILTGTVVYVAPGSPQGTYGNVSIVQNDYALVKLSTPTNLLHIFTLSANVIDNSSVTVDGYPSQTFAGIPTGHQVHTEISTTPEIVTNCAGVMVDENPLIQGASGSPVIDTHGDVIGIVSSMGGGYQYIAEITPHIEMAAEATLLGINPVTTAQLAELA